jgi:shikimate kinase
MSLVLIGYRGSGKTTIGRGLAIRLRRPFIDADEVIVARASKSIREIFEQDGEHAFRQHETKVLADSISRLDHVLSFGGGIVESEENRRLLRSSAHAIVYLRCDAEELLRRIERDALSGQMRPPLTPLGGGIEEIRSVLARREPIYRSLMTAELDVTHLTPEQAVDHIAGLGSV